MFRLPAVVFAALFFVIPAVTLAQITPVWFTLNPQEGQAITVTRSIIHCFGQVASICAFAESTGPCSAGAGERSLEAWPSPKTFDDTSNGVKLASLLFQRNPASLDVGLLGHSRYSKECSFGENLCLSVASTIIGPSSGDFLTN